MKPDEPSPDDAMLHAFVDGQLPPEQVDAVLQRLREKPEDAVRVAEWQAQRLALRQWHRSIDAGPVPEALLRPLRTRQSSLPWWRQALAAAVLLGVGATGGWLWSAATAPDPSSQMAQRGFVRDAVLAHAVFAPEARHPVEVTAADEAHLVAWLSRRLGSALKAPALHEQGFRLLGGRLLPGDASPRAQFMYEDARGRRVTLYVTVFSDGDRPAETSFRSLRDGPVEAFYWVEGTFGYALAGELPAAEMMALARDVYRQVAR